MQDLLLSRLKYHMRDALIINAHVHLTCCPEITFEAA